MSLVGNLLLSRFRIDAPLNLSQPEQVYRGWDLKRNIPVVITLYPQKLRRDPAVLIFDQAGATMQTLSHPNVLPYYGLYDEAEREFLIEKYIEGQTLDAVQSGRPMAFQETMIILKALCQALIYLHGLGLVHGNLKPTNVLVGRDGEIRLTNIGFSRQSGSTAPYLSSDQNPAYLAPEQIQGYPVTAESDIYALGVILYEMLTGQHPFPAALQGGQDAIRGAILSSNPPDPRQVNPAVPRELAQVALTAMARTPATRYHSPQEMLEVACAVLGYTPPQVASRLGSGPAVIPGATIAAAAMAPPRVPATQVTPAAPSVGLPGGTQRAPEPPYGGTAAYPPLATSYTPEASAYPPAAGGYPPATSGYPPATSGYPAAAPEKGRPAWLWLLIGAGGGLLLLCLLVALGAGLGWAGGLFTTATPTATFTATFTLPPPTATLELILPTLTPLPSVTPLPPSAPPTQAPPPTQALPPTVPPTYTPLPTIPLPPTATSPPSIVVLTIWNFKATPLYAFRDGTLMGTSAIPPNSYIWYKIPPGKYEISLCVNPNHTQCVYDQLLTVDHDMEIKVR